MPTHTSHGLALTGEPLAIARRIASDHRALIGGSGLAKRDLPRTLVACSGGADSCALVVALAHARFPVAVAHILHDIRPESEAIADRDAAHALADRFGLQFVDASIKVRNGGNVEAVARRERYRALSVLAKETGCPFVATAHHADDQLETLVMALIRGAGPHGLRGIAPTRRLTSSATLVRPMLRVTRAESVALCDAAEVTFRFDSTNSDTSRTRAALRLGPLDAIARARPGSALRASRTAQLMRDVADLVDDAIARVPTIGPHAWSRAVLRAAPDVVVGGVLRRAFGSLTQGAGADRLTGRMTDGAVRAIRSPATDPRVFEWPGRVGVRVTAREVRVSRDPSPSR